jgi:hypothetical protein
MRLPALAIALVLAPLAARAQSLEERAARAMRTFEHTLPPGGVAEECVRLEPGRSRAFEWTADGPLDFNIHFHSGAKVTYPVKLANQKQGRGKFTASAGEDYCWMWSAKFTTKLTGTLGPEE